MRQRLLIVSVGAMVALTGCMGGVAFAGDGVPARVVSVNNTDHAAILEQQGGAKRWTLSGAQMLEAAGRYVDEGDFVTVTGDPPAVGSSITIRSASIDFWPRIIAILLSGLVLLLAACYASNWRPQRFLVGADERVSNSKCQVVLWFGIAMSTYLATLALRLIESDWQLVGGISIPANVLAMTGLSGLTYAGAKMIAVSKNDGNPPASAPAVGVPPVAVGTQKQKATEVNWRTDLFTNDQGELDFGDFQMILIVWFAVIIYAISAYLMLGNLQLQAHVSLPDVDGSLLAAFGVGQGAYLAKKAALPVGTG